MSQNEKYLKVLKVAHENLLGMVRNTMHRNLWWTLWDNLVLRILDARAAFPLRTGEG